jgi:hypothetical protein
MQQKARMARMANPPTTPMTIPAIAPPDMDELLTPSLADPAVCTVPVLVPDPVSVVVEAVPPVKQERSLPSTTVKILLLAAIRSGSLSLPAK